MQKQWGAESHSSSCAGLGKCFYNEGEQIWHAVFLEITQCYFAEYFHG